MLTGPVPSCPQGIIQEVDDLLENPEDLGTQPSSEQNCVASNLLLIMEHVLRELSTALPNWVIDLQYSRRHRLSAPICPQAPLWPFPTPFLPHSSWTWFTVLVSQCYSHKQIKIKA